MAHASIQSDDITLTAATVETVLQLIVTAGAAQAKITGVGIYFKGTSATAAPVEVEFCEQDSNIGGTSATPLPFDTNIAATAISTLAQYADGGSSEPSTNLVFKRIAVHPQGGYEYQAPFGKEYVIKANRRFGVRANAPTGVACVCTIEFEE